MARTSWEVRFFDHLSSTKPFASGSYPQGSVDTDRDACKRLFGELTRTSLIPFIAMVSLPQSDRTFHFLYVPPDGGWVRVRNFGKVQLFVLQFVDALAAREKGALDLREAALEISVEVEKIQRVGEFPKPCSTAEALKRDEELHAQKDAMFENLRARPTELTPMLWGLLDEAIWKWYW